jgi:UDP-N-acetyl-2-amino-2-deoxyglucuronate dehydrogenase
MKIWNIGIIGAGMVSDFHALAIKSIPNAKLIGFCSAGYINAEKLALKYSCKAFKTMEEMIQSDEIDIVSIATPSGYHLEPAIEAARFGKHVICEKPMEITLERIDKMIAAHKNYGTRLGGIFNYRFNDVVKLLKNAIDTGRFGTISCASVYIPWWRSDEYYSSSWRGTKKLDGGGALMNQSVHMIDMLQYMMGPIESLQAYTASRAHRIEVEDTGVAVLRFKNNALGIIYGTTASFPGQYRRMEITGSKGTAIMVDNSLKVWQFAEELKEDREIIRKFSEIEGGGGVSDPAAISFEPHAKNIAAFIDALENEKKFEIEGLEARKSVEIVLAIYTSAREKKMIYLHK